MYKDIVILTRILKSQWKSIQRQAKGKNYSKNLYVVQNKRSVGVLENSSFGNTLKSVGELLRSSPVFQLHDLLATVRKIRSTISFSLEIFFGF